jgi:hypothetical protein
MHVGLFLLSVAHCLIVLVEDLENELLLIHQLVWALTHLTYG